MKVELSNSPLFIQQPAAAENELPPEVENADLFNADEIPDEDEDGGGGEANGKNEVNGGDDGDEEEEEEGEDEDTGAGGKDEKAP